MSEFMRSMMNAAFKSNQHLERAVLTGITRVSKESIFSDLNNLMTAAVTSRLYENAFGFTEGEVAQSLKEFGLHDEADAVKHWYDGFRFGGSGSIYNPWSITNYLKSGEFKAYWANTSSNKLVGDLIRRGSADLKAAMEELLGGGTFCTEIDEQVVFDQLNDSDEAVWSLLLAGGYLKIAGRAAVTSEFGLEDAQYKLAITNLETISAFRKMIHGWFSNKTYGYNDFIKAFLAGDLERMNTFMNQVALCTISSFDSGIHPSNQAEPERFYHGFVLGLIVDLGGRYTITSNRESGFGRYDVLLEPQYDANDAVIFEFKVSDPKREKNLEETADDAVRQIIEKNYVAVLASKRTKERIRIYGFAFEGKKVLISGGYLNQIEMN